MTRDERRDMMLLYAAGLLEDADARAVRHLLDAGSPKHLADLAEARATLAHLPLLLDEEAPSHDASNRLMERVRRTVPPTLPMPAAAPTTPTPPAAASREDDRPLPWLWAVGGALAAGLVAVVATWGIMSIQLNRTQNTVIALQNQLNTQTGKVQQLTTELVNEQSEVRTLERDAKENLLLVQDLRGQLQRQGTRLANLDAEMLQSQSDLADARSALIETRAALTDTRTALAASREAVAAADVALAEARRRSELLDERSLRVATLAGTEASPEAWGRVLWNPESGRGAAFAGNLAPLPAGREYQFWYVTAAGEKISGGTFTLDPQREAFLPLTTPEALAADDTVNLYAITQEPAGGSEQPTGDILVAGEAG